MSQNNINNELKQAFIESIFRLSEENPYGIICRDDQFVTTNDTLQKLIDRLFQDQFTVLPFRDRQRIIWIVLAQNERDLVVHYEELKNFLSPYFAQPVNNERLFFNANKKGIGSNGAELFPDGYFAFVSTISNQPQIFSLLSIWLKLDERRPEISYEELTVNAFTLRNKFQKAISLQEWGTAESILLEIEKGHFLSDENIKYLRIQLYSSQGKWGDIWESEVFDLLAGFRYLPKKVHLSLLLSFYQSVLAEVDLNSRYDRAFELYQTKRLRVLPLLRSQLGIDDDYAIRVFSYEAAYNKELEKLQRYLEISHDQQTQELINYLIAQLKGEGMKKPLTTKEKLEKARSFYQEGKYEDAFLYLLDCEESLEKVTMLAGIGTMTETEETITYAYEEYNKLSDEEQQILLKSPHSKALIFYILNWNQGIGATDSQTLDTINKIPTWNKWFLQLIHFDERQIEQLEQYLHDMNEQSENISWSFKKLEELSEYLVAIVIEPMNPSQKKLLSIALPMFLSEIISHSKFPNKKAMEIYDYTLDILLTYAKKTEENTKFFIRLIEALLYLDLEKVDHCWDKISNWFQIPPVDRLSAYLLETLELFLEYGLANDKLKIVWDNWLSAVLERTSMNETQIKSWYDLGCMIGGDSYLIEGLQEKIASESVEDPLLNLGEMIITIFTLREKPAQRAAERIMKRNPELKIKVCTDNRLTDRSKLYAQQSDLSIIVTTCMSHALTYGISPFLKNEPLFPRSAGETAIIEKLEEYARSNQFEAKIS